MVFRLISFPRGRNFSFHKGLIELFCRAFFQVKGYVGISIKRHGYFTVAQHLLHHFGMLPEFKH